MLNTPRFILYKNATCLAFAADVLEILSKNEVPTLATQVADLQNAYDIMSLSFKKDLGSAKTEDLKSLDQRRDDAIRGILALARSYEYHFEEAKQKAGIALVRSIRKFSDNIPKLSYKDESEVIKNLLEDWTKEATLLDALALLDIADWKTELETANKEFDKVYYERTMETVAKESPVSTSDARKIVEEKYRIMADFAKANALLNPSETLTTVIKAMNVVIDKFNTEVSRTSGGGEIEETEEEQEN